MKLKDLYNDYGVTCRIFIFREDKNQVNNEINKELK